MSLDSKKDRQSSNNDKRNKTSKSRREVAVRISVNFANDSYSTFLPFRTQVYLDL